MNLLSLFSKNKNLPDTQADSAILSFYTQGSLLTKAFDGQLDGMRCSTYATIPTIDQEFFNSEIAIINVLDLPFNTETHLVGLSKEHKTDRDSFANLLKNMGMEKVELEGDFGDYFELYAAKGQQVNVREVLEPDAMQYVVDYCRAHFWEINRAELYFVASTKDKTDGDIFEEAKKFVAQIKPALKPGDPGAPVVHHDVPYGEYDGSALNCPICNKPMVCNNLWHVCPDGQGILVSGRELIGIRNHTIKITADASRTAKHDQLKCPNCQNPMVPVDYEETGVMIDSCSNCPYRWLDADEIITLSTIFRTTVETG